MDHPPFPESTGSRMKDVADYWPLRLLHIPTMTSFERNSNGRYGNVEKPNYNILTYTWGRWKIRDPAQQKKPSLPIKGTKWKIPAVKEEHFTVDAFKAVLNRMRQEGGDWAWIDIACIDQEDEIANAEEVGRQASIFKKARHVYVWLSKLSTDTLQKVVYEIRDLGDEVEQGLKKSLSIDLKDYPYVNVDRLSAAFDTLLKDPWFSSLWTLQEAILRPDARVLSKSAEPVKFTERYSLSLRMIRNVGSLIYPSLETIGKCLDALGRGRDRRNPHQKRIQDHAAQLEQSIQRAGFNLGIAGQNANVQYGIAKHRRTSREVDRIYAIMQVYNLRVGKSARPKDNPTLPSLVKEFALAINAKCLIQGQAFVHTRPPSGPTWQITEDSAVPRWLKNLKDAKPRCRIKHDPTRDYLQITGELCLLSDLHRPRNIRRNYNPDPIKVAVDSTGKKLTGLFYEERFLHDDPDGLYDYLKLESRLDTWALIIGKIDGRMEGHRGDGSFVALLLQSDETDWQMTQSKKWQTSELGSWQIPGSGTWPHSNGPCRRMGVCLLGPETLEKVAWRETTILLK